MDGAGPAPLRDIAGRYMAATGAQPVFLLEGHRGLFAAKWKLPRHHVSSLWSPHHVLGYRASGTATILRARDGIEQRRIPLIGSVTFSPGDHPAQWASDSPIEVIHLYIAADALPRLRDFFGIADPWLAAYFRLMDAECVLGAADSLFLDETQPLLVRHLVRKYSYGARSALAAAVRVAPLTRALTRRVEEYIDGHMNADISLHHLAELAHLSVDHFVRAFRAATGITPHRFVLERRLARAARTLRSGNAAVAEIAKACGFRSPAHFSAKFRARFGVTPSDYRRSA